MKREGEKMERERETDGIGVARRYLYQGLLDNGGSGRTPEPTLGVWAEL